MDSSNIKVSDINGRKKQDNIEKLAIRHTNVDENDSAILT